MEDRKRPAHDQNDAAHPAKRQATVNGTGKGHVDDDMPWKDDLEVNLSETSNSNSGKY